jgi:protein KRI1
MSDSEDKENDSTSSSEEEEDDEFAELDTQELDDQFLKLLPMINNKDPKLFQKEAKFFEEPGTMYWKF